MSQLPQIGMRGTPTAADDREIGEMADALVERCRAAVQQTFPQELLDLMGEMGLDASSTQGALTAILYSPACRRLPNPNALGFLLGAAYGDLLRGVAQVDIEATMKAVGAGIAQALHHGRAPVGGVQ